VFSLDFWIVSISRGGVFTSRTFANVLFFCFFFVGIGLEASLDFWIVSISGGTSFYFKSIC
jgi:hypothetical protein